MSLFKGLLRWIDLHRKTPFHTFIDISNRSINSRLVSRFSGVIDGGQVVCSNGEAEPGHGEPTVIVFDAAIGLHSVDGPHGAGLEEEVAVLFEYGLEAQDGGAKVVVCLTSLTAEVLVDVEAGVEIKCAPHFPAKAQGESIGQLVDPGVVVEIHLVAEVGLVLFVAGVDSGPPIEPLRIDCLPVLEFGVKKRLKHSVVTTHVQPHIPPVVEAVAIPDHDRRWEHIPIDRKKNGVLVLVQRTGIGNKRGLPPDTRRRVVPNFTALCLFLGPCRGLPDREREKMSQNQGEPARHNGARCSLPDVLSVPKAHGKKPNLDSV